MRAGIRGDPDFVRLQKALAGQFSLERELGRGGGAIVYLAREIQLDRPVAIKVLRPALAARPGAREHFLREARTAAKLAHPNIVPVFQADTIDGWAFFTMAYVDGQTLAARVRTRGALRPLEAAAILQDVAWALSYAHARGVVHRDVKPENILIDRATARALVTDFGIAQLPESTTALEESAVVGTAHYMSPEQASGHRVDARSDIYALGAVGWYALTGRPVFDGTPEAVLQKHISERPPPLLAVAPDVPDALARAIDRALAKSPAARQPDAESFATSVALASIRQAELTAPLRIWVAGGNEVRYVVAALLGTAGLAVARGHWWVEFVAATGAAACAFALIELLEVRRLLALGYDLDDLRRALEEERRGQRGARPERPAIRWPALGGRRAATRPLGIVVTLGATILLAERVIGHHEFSAIAAALMIIALGIVATGLGATATDRDSTTTLRAWLWNGPIGVLLVRLARWRVRRFPIRGPEAALPIEAALRLAARDVYDSLPVDTQQRITWVPATVLRLEGAAAALRRRSDDLGRALSLIDQACGTESVDGCAANARRGGAVAEIRAERAAADQQLTSVLEQLERIRTDLMAVQAAADDVHVLAGRLAVLEGAAHPLAASSPAERTLDPAQ